MLKKLLLVLIMGLSTAAMAEELTYRTDIYATRFNSSLGKMFDAKLTLNYSGGKEPYLLLYQKDGITSSAILFDRKDANTLIAAIEKYEKWNALAIKKGVKIEKVIGDLSAKGSSWKVGNSDWRIDITMMARASFFSQSKTWHQLVIYFDKATASTNALLTYKSPAIYFDLKDAIIFKEALRQSSIDKFLRDVDKQNEIESDFN